MHLTALKLQLGEGMKSAPRRETHQKILRQLSDQNLQNPTIITATRILCYSLSAPQSHEFHTSNVLWSSTEANANNNNTRFLNQKISDESESVLTAKVEVDAGGHLSILVLGFHFVKSSVRLDHIIQFQNHRVLVPPVLVDADPRPVVLHNRHVLTEPHHVRLRTGSWNCALVQWQLQCASKSFW